MVLDRHRPIASLTVMKDLISDLVKEQLMELVTILHLILHTAVQKDLYPRNLMEPKESSLLEFK